MGQDPRGSWLAASGLTRREQRVLVFLIVVIGAGLTYQHYQGNWRREALVLHRGEPAAGPSGAGPRRPSPPTPGPAAASGRLDINTAGAQELETLPGIGPVRAAAIVRSRQDQGPFRSVDDLKRISGIGEKTVEGLRAYVLEPQAASASTSTTPRAQPPQPDGPEMTPAPAISDASDRVNLNTATIEELDRLDGIGPVLARRIVEYRQKHGFFRTPADIQKVSGIGPKTFEKNRHRLTVGTPPR